MVPYRLIGNVVTVCLVLIALSALIIALAPLVGWRIDTVLSGSMEPSIATGSVVIISPISANDIRVGDVIAFTRDGLDVCHRAISIHQGPPLQFTTKGDSNTSPDLNPVDSNHVIGKVLVSIPYVGYVIYFIKTPIGLFLTVIFPLLIVIGIEVKELIFDKKEADSPRDSE